MATEIMSQKLILLTSPDASREVKRAAGEAPIIHNFQHDLESFFWLLLWILTTRISACPPGLKDYTDQLFPVHGDPFMSRVMDFQNRVIGFSVRRHLPDNMKVFADHIRNLNNALCEASIKRLLLFDDVASYVPLYGAVRKALEFCMERSHLVELKAGNDRPKRKRLDSTQPVRTSPYSVSLAARAGNDQA